MASTEQFELRNSGGSLVTGQAANLAFRVSPYGGGDVIAGLTFTETPSSSGVYVVTGFTTRYPSAKLFLSGTEQTGYGIQNIGDDENYFVDKTSAETIAGIKTFTVPPVGSTASTADTQYIRHGEAVRITSNQTIDGIKSFEDYPVKVYEVSYVAPTDSGQFTPKQYVDEAIAANGVEAFQESVNKVRVSPEFTDIANRDYGVLVDGVLSFNTPSNTNRCLVEVVGQSNLQYILAGSGSLVNYVNVIGSGHHIQVCYRDATATAAMRIENQTVIFGTHSGAVGARTYTNIEFHNCIIYHYAGLTLSATVIKDCLVLGSSTNAVTLSGSSKAINCHFNNAPTETSVLMIGCTTGFTYAPPSDISPADA